MPAFSKILCVIDPTSDVQHALQRAIWLAEKSGASIDLLICSQVDSSSYAGILKMVNLEKAKAELVDYYQSKLDALARIVEAAGIEVSTTLYWDKHLYEGIVRQSIALNADVVLKDTHYHSAISRTLLTHTDWNLIRTCPVPLWLVTPNKLQDDINIITAVDPFNENDKPAILDSHLLDIGSAIASDVDGKLHSFHSFDPRVIVAASSTTAYVPVSLPILEIEEEMTTIHGKRLKELSQAHDIPEDRAHLAIGMTHEELPELARKLGATLVIMGAVSRSRMKRVFVGATAERTLGLLPCDLLVVKPNPFTTPVGSAEDRDD